MYMDIEQTRNTGFENFINNVLSPVYNVNDIGLGTNE